MRRVSLVLLLAALPGLSGVAGCYDFGGDLLPARESARETIDGELVARFVHITDMHVVDEESPARFAGAHAFTRSAWRPYEAYSTQLFDGILRTANRIHASGRPIDFLIHTGDACDNAQRNELEWLLGVLDGGEVNPLTGPDDRPASARPLPALDPHAAFVAQGLYRAGVHGEAASIPWYGVFGNHDVYSIGVFPIVEDAPGRRRAPLPLDWRPDLLLPGELNPLSPVAHGNVTPARPGPPDLFALPTWVEPKPERAFFSRQEFIAAMFDTQTGPPGHGFSSPDGPGWYSLSPGAGLRLIGLDSCDPVQVVPGLFYADGAISSAQLAFLEGQLAAADAAGEWVIVASHHPSAYLLEIFGTAVNAAAFRALLNAHPSVILHLAGHSHRNRVTDHGGYLEIETCSTLDAPQEGRLIEIWRSVESGEATVAYEMFSHLDDALPPLGDDPLRALREEAHAIAAARPGASARGRPPPELEAAPDARAGGAVDRAGRMRRLRRADTSAMAGRGAWIAAQPER